MKIEGRTLSAIEAEIEFNQFIDIFAQKEVNQCLPFVVRSLMLKLTNSAINSDSDIDKEFVKTSATEFIKQIVFGTMDFWLVWFFFIKEFEIFFIGQI